MDSDSGKKQVKKLSRWYLIIQEFAPPFKYLPGHVNAVTDCLSRNVTVGAVAEKLPITEKYIFHE